MRTSKVKRWIVGGLAATTLIGAGAFLDATPAAAVTVRPGAKFGQIDVMLDARETEQVRRDYWSASVVCWQAGLGGKVATVPCATLMTVCAAQGYYSSPRKRGAATFGIGNAWCWTY